MAEASPNLLLKIIWMVHFALTSWAIMSSYLPFSYSLTQMGVLAVGLWAIISKEDLNALVMFMVTLCFSVFNDIMLISIYQPRADDNIEREGVAHGIKNEFRWALGMSIMNLLLKPVSMLLVFLIHRSRTNGSDFQIPGLGVTGQSSSNQAGRGNYNNIESAQDSHPGVYGRPPYPYQSAPPPPNYDSNKSTPQERPPQA